MSNDFRPGVDAARRALGSAIPIVTRDHPGGEKGVKLSLDEVASRIRVGRNDPRVRAWAIRAVKAAGGPQGKREQAEAIRKALKDATVYVNDPVNTEFIQAAHETLCLDDKGLCFRGGDCDDLVVAYGSATLSIGIPTQIIGEGFGFDGIPSHVLAAIQDGSTWLRVDPSTDKVVGDFVQGTSERWIDPMAKDGTKGMGEAKGDFVGVGQIGAPHGLGAQGASSAISGLQIAGSIVAAMGILGAIAWLLPDPNAKYRVPIDPREEHLCYRNQAFSVAPRVTIVRGTQKSLYMVHVGDEMFPYGLSADGSHVWPFTTRADAVRFAKSRIDSDHPPRTQACRARMPRAV